MLALDFVVHLQEIPALNAKRAFYNLQKIRGLYPVRAIVPAAMRIPVCHAAEKQIEGNFVVIGQGQPACCGGVEGREHGGLGPFELLVLSITHERALQRLLIIAGLAQRLRVGSPEPAHRLRKPYPLRAPAEEDAVSRKFPYTL